MSQSTGAVACRPKRMDGSYSLSESGCVALAALGGLALGGLALGGLLALADELGLGLDLVGSSTSRRGSVIDAMTVSGSSRIVTPCGRGDVGERERVVDLQAETSCWIDSGMSPGSASTLSSRVLLLEHAALDRCPAPRRRRSSSRVTIAWIATSMRTRRRSMCIVSPRTGWCWASLTTALAVCAVEVELDDRAGRRAARGAARARRR